MSYFISTYYIFSIKSCITSQVTFIILWLQGRIFYTQSSFIPQDLLRWNHTMFNFLNDEHARMYVHMHAHILVVVAMLSLIHIVWRLINNYEISNSFDWYMQEKSAYVVFIVSRTFGNKQVPENVCLICLRRRWLFIGLLYYCD